MAKAVKKVKVAAATSVSKEAKAQIKSLQAEIKALKAAHKKELNDVVVATYDRAVHAAFEEFERREVARDAVIEKAVKQALVEFEKGLDKKAKKSTKKAKKAVAKKKA